MIYKSVLYSAANLQMVKLIFNVEHNLSSSTFSVFLD